MSEDYYGEDSSGFINNEENIKENSDLLIKTSTLENNFFKTEEDLVMIDKNRPEIEVLFVEYLVILNFL